MDAENEKSFSNDATRINTMESNEFDKTGQAKDIESGQARSTVAVHPGHERIASVDSLPKSLQEAAAREEIDKSERVIFEDGPIPDGGFGWIIVLCQFISQTATWGMMTTYGVFIAWFQQHDSYPGSPIQYAWIAGLAVSSALFFSPFTSYICKLLPLRVNLAIAQVILSLGFILAGFSSKIWQLALTQGLMCGVGIGWNFMATQPLISQWFQKRRAVAMGLGSGGVGFGGLVFAITSRVALAAHGIRIAYVINGVIVFVLLTPTTILFKPRMRVINPKFKAIRWQLLRNHGLKLTILWSFFVMLGYLIPLLSIATYATRGVGLSQAQGAALQAVLATGQLVGRPSLGLLLDAFGRIYMTSLITFLSGVTCLCIWMFAKSFGLLIFFGLVNGILSGIWFSALGPVLSDVVGLKDFSDALSIIWVGAAPITLVSVPIAFAINEYSQNTLHRTGPDVYQIGIGLAGGANIVAAIALLAAKRYQRRDKD